MKPVIVFNRLANRLVVVAFVPTKFVVLRFVVVAFVAKKLRKVEEVAATESKIGLEVKE